MNESTKLVEAEGMVVSDIGSSPIISTILEICSSDSNFDIESISDGWFFSYQKQ